VFIALLMIIEPRGITTCADTTMILKRTSTPRSAGGDGDGGGGDQP